MIISVMDYVRADVIPDSVVRQLIPRYASDVARMSEQTASWPHVGPFASIDRERLIEKVADYYRSGEAERRFIECVSGFDEGQSKVVRMFLEYMRDAHSTEMESRNAETAIERYWHQF